MDKPSLLYSISPACFKSVNHLDEDEKSSLKLVARAVSAEQPVVFSGLHELSVGVLSVVVVLSAAANLDNNEEVPSTDIISSSFIIICVVV